MRRTWSFLSLAALFALAAYLSLFAGSFDHIADDPGLGWHLQNGERIDTLGEVPYVDPFLARATIDNPFVSVGEGRPWVSDQWLSDLIFHKIFISLGWPGLYALVSGLFLIAYFGIAADGIRRAGQGAILVLLAVILAFKLGQVHLIVRPVIFSIFLFPLVLHGATSLARRPGLSWRDVGRECGILLPLFVVWANLHPAFVYGLCVMAICALACGARERRDGLKVFALFMACVCSTTINPYGIELHKSIIQLGGSSYLRSMTTEWYPINLTSPEGMFLLALSLIPLSALLISREVRRSVGLFEILVALVFIGQALWAVRVVPFASFACLPLWAACFGSRSFVPNLTATSLSARVMSSISEREARLVAPGLIASLVIALFGGFVITRYPERVLPREIGSPHERALREVIAVQGLPERRGAILASLNWGGAITLVVGDRLKPVLDDRTVLVGEKLYRAYGQSLESLAAFQELVDVFGVTITIVPAGAPLEKLLSTDPDWSRLPVTGEISVFSRR